MNRKTKFRAWDYSVKKMFKVFEITWNKFGVINIYDDRNLRTNTSLMQYTGLKDKDGVEIYEKDIVEFLDEKWIIFYEVRNAKFTLTKDNMFPIRDFNWLDLGEGGYKQDIKKSGDIKVIGNIHQNLELLS